MERKILIISLFVFVVCNSLFALQVLPNFTLEDANGKKVKSSELVGQAPVLIDFWATFCSPCMKELPELSKLQTKYDTLINVVCISVDKPRAVAKAKAIVKSKKFSFTTLFDCNKEVQNLFNIKSIPRTIIFDKNGNMVYDHTGYTKGDEVHLEEQLIKLLNKNVGSDSLEVNEQKIILEEKNIIDDNEKENIKENKGGQE